jgi:apolipoprotein N-acyltransferase
VPPEIPQSKRLAGTGAAFLLLYLASPGILTGSGVWPLALASVALWSAFASLPGKRAWLVEWATSSLAWAGICSWAAHVWWGTLIVLGPGHGVYFAVQGALLRRFARRLPLAIAAPCAWMLVEGVRASLEPPFGIQWMRLGAHLHDQAWIAGSARVWGTGGLSLALAALGGLAADLARGRTPALAWIAGLAPLALGVALCFTIPAPRTVDGPRVLLVQPGIRQERKMEQPAWEELMREQLALTRRAIADARSHGGEVDLVAWGESMLLLDVCDPGLAAALANGARADAWVREVDEESVRTREQWEREIVRGAIFGAGEYPGLLPAGTAFAAGAEYLTARDDRVRRQASYFLWTGETAARQGPASKRHLVPGAETMLGLERFAWVRDAIYALAAYVPDLLAASGPPPVLELPARDGRRFRFAASICFDNAFDDVFTRPERESGVDFHLVASNEAWFKESQEFDQMLAFSRLAAIATGRSVVRATNSGVSCVIAPDGREVGRVRDGERDRAVAGWLAAVVPVPGELAVARASPEAGSTPFVRFERVWQALWIAAPLAVLGWLALRGRSPVRLPRGARR